MAVRMRDVAGLAGVSTRTVSNVVNGSTHVSAQTRQRVQQALDELGYEMNAAARSLKSGRTGMIALVVSELHSPYFAELADAVVRAADRRDLTVLIEVTEGLPERELKVLSGGRKHLTDGTVLSPVALNADAGLKPRRDLPLVLLGESSLATSFDHVGIDNAEATRIVVDHLLTIGRTRIAAIGAHPLLPAALIRRQAFEAALGDAGLRPHCVVETATWERQAGAEAVDSLLRAPAGPPDAIFGFNDTVALGALRGLRERGVDVPADIALAGIDDIDESSFASPSLTTIAPDIATLAERALDLLVDQIGRQGDPDAARAPRQEWVPFTLIVRESTVGGQAASLPVVDHLASQEL
jgi:DNA-binding LacI/PurR family transcriptional regulator